MDIKQRKVVLIAGAGVIALILTIAWLFASGTVGGSTPVELRVSPMDSTITLDGKPFKSGKVSIPSGKHTLVGTRKDFTKATLDIDGSKLEDDQKIYLILGADSDAAKQYLTENPDEIMIREGASGDQFAKSQDITHEKYGFTQYLPYENLDYSIDYAIDSDNNIRLDVTLKPITNPAETELYRSELQGYKQRAIDWMKAHSIDTSKITITWSPDPDQ